MANGVAALRLVDLTVSAPAAAPAKTEIEAAIGEAVASATAGLCFASVRVPGRRAPPRNQARDGRAGRRSRHAAIGPRRRP